MSPGEYIGRSADTQLSQNALLDQTRLKTLSEFIRTVMTRTIGNSVVMEQLAYRQQGHVTFTTVKASVVRAVCCGSLKQRRSSRG